MKILPRKRANGPVLVPESASKCNILRCSEPVLTLKEAAVAAGISVRQLHRMRARGFGVRVIRLDGCVRVSPSALREWLEEHTEKEVGVLPRAYRKAPQPSVRGAA